MDAFPVQISANEVLCTLLSIASMTLPETGDRVKSLGGHHVLWWEGPGSKHFMKCGEIATVVEVPGEDGIQLQKASGEKSGKGGFAIREVGLFLIKKSYSSVEELRAAPDPAEDHPLNRPQGTILKQTLRTLAGSIF